MKFFVQKITLFLKKIDYQLVPPHEFINSSSSERLLKKYIPNLIINRKIGNLIPVSWYFLTIFISPLILPFYLLINRFFPFKVLKIDLSQIGSVFWLGTVASKVNSHNRKDKIIVCLPNFYLFQNQHIFKFLSPKKFNRFIFVKNIFLRSIFSSISWFKFANIDTKNYECYINNIYSECIEDINECINFDLNKSQKNKDLENARNEFIDFALSKKGLVTFNLRSSTFYAENRRSLRNVNPITYKGVIKHLNDENYSICFTHSPGQELLKFLNENQIPFKIYGERNLKGEFLNLLSLINCKFLVGSSTGASIIPLMANIPVYWTNSYQPYWVPLKRNDVVIWKKYFFENGKKLTFEDFVNCNLHIPSKMKTSLDKLNINCVDNTEEELLNGLKLFLELQDCDDSSIEKIRKKYSAKYIQNLIFHKKCRWTKFSLSTAL